MKTASAGYNTAIAASSSAPTVLVKLELSSSTLYLSTKDITVSGQAYDGRLLGDINIFEKANWRRGICPTGDITLEFNNLDDWFGGYDTEIWGNATVTIWQHMDSLTLANSLQRFKGKIRGNSPTVTEKKVSINVSEDWDWARTTTIPDSVVEGPPWTNAPPESIGKALPVVYGARAYNLCKTVAAVTSFERKHNLVKAIQVDTQMGGGLAVWYIAGHKLDSITNLWAYDTGLKRLVKVSSYSTVQNTSDGCIVSVSVPMTLIDYHLPSGDYSTNEANTSSVSDPEDGCDSDNDTNATLEAEDAAGHLDEGWCSLTVEMPDWDQDVDDSDISSVKLYSRTDASGILNGTFYVQGGYDLTGNSSSLYALLFTIPGASATKALIESDVVFHCRGAWGMPPPFDNNSGKVYMAFKEITYSKNESFQIYAEVNGWEYGSWVSSRASHPDTSTPGNGGCIENMGGIIESLVREYGGVTPNTSAFDTLATGFGTDSIQGLFDLPEQNNLYDLLDELCQRQNVIMYKNEDAEVTVSRHTAGSASIKSFTSANIVRGSLLAQKMSITDVYNDITLKYMRNPDGSEMQEEVNDDDATSQSNYGTRVKNINDRFVGDSSGAGAENDLNKALWKDQRTIVEFDTNLEGSTLERGDIIDVTHNAGGYNWSAQKFEVLEIRQKGRIVHVKGYEYS